MVYRQIIWLKIHSIVIPEEATVQKLPKRNKSTWHNCPWRQRSYFLQKLPLVWWSASCCYFVVGGRGVLHKTGGITRKENYGDIFKHYLKTSTRKLDRQLSEIVVFVRSLWKANQNIWPKHVLVSLVKPWKGTTPTY